MTLSKRILLTGGGTAGHVTPHFALLADLIQNGFEIHYAGSANGIERELLAGHPDIPYHVIKCGKLRRYPTAKNLIDPLRSVLGVAQAVAICRKIRPDIVFSKGGFVSLPVVIGASLCGIPCVLHESDFSIGLANKLCLPFAKRVCTTFEHTVAQIGPKAVYTGNAIRTELFEGKASQGLQTLGFSGQKPVLLVTGGSQGAQAINRVVRQGLQRFLGHFDIVHLCGKGNLDHSFDNIPGYVQKEYATAELPNLFACASIVISRAGSNTISELAALHIPHLLIPLGVASRGDQVMNAAAYERAGYSKMLLQSDATPDRLFDEIMTLHANRQSYIKAMEGADFLSGKQRIVQVILETQKGS